MDASHTIQNVSKDFVAWRNGFIEHLHLKQKKIHQIHHNYIRLYSLYIFTFTIKVYDSIQNYLKLYHKKGAIHGIK